MADDSGSPRLQFHEVAAVLRLVAAQPPGLTLVGGQALNYWAERYKTVSELLRTEAPFTSGDIDFLGDLEVARRLAKDLHASLETKGIYNTTGVTLAVITYRDERNEPRLIHFLGDMAGVQPAEVARTALVLEDHLRVMHPVLCMESRLSNVIDLEAYRNPHGRKQARASIACAREFVKEVLESGDLRTVLDLNERIFRFSRRRARACDAEGFRPFDAIVLDERLSPNFRDIRYPQMKRAMGLEP